MDAGLLDVLQDAADHRVGAVGDQVEVELDGVSRKRSSSTGWPSETSAAARMKPSRLSRS